MSSAHQRSKRYAHHMYLYVDEGGHTGTNLFDPEQPMLYYGVLSSTRNVYRVSKPNHAIICFFDQVFDQG
jgi:hypothetical protein